MKIHDPKLRNMAHALYLRVFIRFKGTNFYILFLRLIEMVIVFGKYIINLVLKEINIRSGNYPMPGCHGNLFLNSYGIFAIFVL